MTVSTRRQPGVRDDDSDDSRGQIVKTYLQLLTESGSALLDDEHARPQLLAQLHSVLDEVLSKPTPGPPASDQLSEHIGRTRASTGIDPALSLQAAALIFQAALPVVTANLTGHAVIDVAIDLNRAILERMSHAAHGYVEYLLTKAHNSSQDERRRISRQLHDIAAPTAAVALQSIELHDIYAADSPADAAIKLDTARTAVRELLTLVRELSSDLRMQVGDRGFAEAITAALATAPALVTTQLRVEGDIDSLPTPFAEEVFLIIREAIRNALAHAQPTTITVTVVANSSGLTAEVVDDGAGFDIPSVYGQVRHVGIDSMRERAQLLSSVLHIDSHPAGGTRVALRVPAATPVPDLTR